MLFRSTTPRRASVRKTGVSCKYKSLVSEVCGVILNSNLARRDSRHTAAVHFAGFLSRRPVLWPVRPRVHDGRQLDVTAPDITSLDVAGRRCTPLKAKLKSLDQLGSADRSTNDALVPTA